MFNFLLVAMIIGALMSFVGWVIGLNRTLRWRTHLSLGVAGVTPLLFNLQVFYKSVMQYGFNTKIPIVENSFYYSIILLAVVLTHFVRTITLKKARC